MTADKIYSQQTSCVWDRINKKRSLYSLYAVVEAVITLSMNEDFVFNTLYERIEDDLNEDA
jgi:hypothetical protein